MATSQTTKIALAVAFFGILSFIFGVIAENKKPASGTPIQGKGVVICKFPSDPTIALGSLSVVTLLLSVIAGHVAVYFPYKGKTVPVQALFQSASLVIFFLIAEAVSAMALGMMLWATIEEGLHHSHNTHHNLDTEMSYCQNRSIWRRSIPRPRCLSHLARVPDLDTECKSRLSGG